jgi:hypothetical protein
MIQATLLTTLACLAAHGITVIALLHLHVRMAPLFLHAVSALAWHIVGIAVLLALGMIHYYWHAAAFFGLGVMLFIFGFSAVYKSVTLRTLIFIAQRPTATITPLDIHRTIVMTSFRDRANLLVESGLVNLGGDGYSLTDAGHHMVHRISMLRRLLKIESAGLYFKQSQKPIQG